MIVCSTVNSFLASFRSLLYHEKENQDPLLLNKLHPTFIGKAAKLLEHQWNKLPSNDRGFIDMYIRRWGLNWAEVYQDLTIDILNRKKEEIVMYREMLPRRAKNGVVMVSFTDYNYLNAFYVSYKVSHLEQYSNFIIVAMDLQAYTVLHNQGYPVAYFLSSYVSEKEIKKESVFATPIFKKKMYIKQQLLRQAVFLGFDILLFDSDVLLLKNPISFIMGYSMCDLISQKDHTVCAGFVFYRSSQQSFLFINNVMKTMRKTGLSDQPSMVSMLATDEHRYICYALLPDYLFSSGDVFFSQYQFYADSIQFTQIMIHNNFVITFPNKIYRLKEMHFYNLDMNKEYSDENARFLVLETIQKGKEKWTLRLMIDIANYFNYSFVVPCFPCNEMVPLPFCNLCGNEPLYCHQDIMKYANKPWKEHTFFSNPLVPSKIRQDYKEARFYQIRIGSYPQMRGRQKSTFVLPDLHHFEALASLFEKNRVIRVQCIY